MLISGISHRYRVGSAAALLSLACAASPLPAHASGDITVSLLQGMVCQISLTFSFGSPVGTSVPAAPTMPVGDQIVASGGSCLAAGLGMSGNQPFAMSGGGQTEVAPTCADLVVLGNGGLVTIGSQQFSSLFSMVGPSAESQWVLAMTPLIPGSAGAGTAQLSLDPASLQACLQPGGTSTLTFTGVAVFAF